MSCKHSKVEQFLTNVAVYQSGSLCHVQHGMGSIPFGNAENILNGSNQADNIAGMAHNNEVWLAAIKLIADAFQIILKCFGCRELIHSDLLHFLIVVQNACHCIVLKWANVDIFCSSLDKSLDNDVERERGGRFKDNLFGGAM